MSERKRERFTAVSNIVAVVVGVVTGAAAAYSFLPKPFEESAKEQQFDRVESLAAAALAEETLERRTVLALQGENELVYAQKLADGDPRVCLLRGFFLYLQADAMRLEEGVPKQQSAQVERKRNERFSEAQRHLQAAQRLDAKSAEPHLFLALVAVGRGERVAAERSFAAALDSFPRHRLACVPNEFAKYLTRSKRFKEAQEYYDLAIAECPERLSRIHANRAANRRSLNDPTQLLLALVDLEFALRSEPGNPQFLRDLGATFLQAKLLENAEEALLAALRAGGGPADEQTFEVLAEVYKAANRAAEAEAIRDPESRLRTFVENWKRGRLPAPGPSKTGPDAPSPP